MVEDVSYILLIHLYGLCQLNDTLIIMQSTLIISIMTMLEDPSGSMGQVVGLPNNPYKPITITAWIRARLCKLQKRCTRLAAASDKVYQLLVHGRWSSPGTPASSTTKSGRHDIAEILLKVALKHQISNQIKSQCQSMIAIYVLTKVCLFVCLMVLNSTFNNISVISWRSVLLVEETGIPRENHRPVASH